MEKKIKNSQPQAKFTGSYKKKSVLMKTCLNEWNCCCRKKLQYYLFAIRLPLDKYCKLSVYSAQTLFQGQTKVATGGVLQEKVFLEI